MRSLGSVLRGVALVALALWIVIALLPRLDAPEAVRGAALAQALPRLTASPAVEAVVARLEAVPSARERDWLAALRDAGVAVRWTGDSAPLALETYPADRKSTRLNSSH